MENSILSSSARLLRTPTWIFDGTVVQAVGGAVYYSGRAAPNMGHKIAVLPKADLSQLDGVTAAFHEKVPPSACSP